MIFHVVLAQLVKRARSTQGGFDLHFCSSEMAASRMLAQHEVEMLGKLPIASDSEFSK